MPCLVGVLPGGHLAVAGEAVVPDSPDQTSIILVAGGTGTLGSAVVTALLARGTPVRVLTRNAHRAVEICVDDIRNAADV